MTTLRPKTEDPLPDVQLVDDECRHCHLPVKVIAVGKERLPVFLEVAVLTVVTEGGRVHAGHPVHDVGTCIVRHQASKS